MNFTNEEFSAFERDLKAATIALCSKYEVKLKKMKLSYGPVDFDLKLTFEKDEEGVNAERIKFETTCFYYGFEPGDYLRLFEYNGVEYEFIGFETSAKKYNCIVREVETGIRSKVNEKFLHVLFEQENKKVEQDFNQTTANMDEINLLSKEELSMLRIKLEKSKRNEKDWALIKAAFIGKEMLTYRPDPVNTLIKCVNGIAVENNYLTVFTSKEAIERHLDELYAEGVMEGTVPIVSYQFEDIIRTADEKQLSVLFDIADEPNRGYYSYDCNSKNMKVVIMTIEG